MKNRGLNIRWPIINVVNDRKNRVNKNTRIIFLFVLLIVVFLACDLLKAKSLDPRSMDFAAFWQGGHMILSGQDPYDHQEWIQVRSIYGTALHSEPTLQYPLPFAVFMAPLAMLPVGQAYFVWQFISELAIIISIFILFSFYPTRTAIFELLMILCLFIFRPTFTILFSGQIVAEMFLFITSAIFLFRKEKWFFGGLILSLMTLKPSIGLSFLILMGIWLIFTKRWKAILGIVAGAILLWGFGALYNPNWVMDYLGIGKFQFEKYLGMQATVWGLTGFLFKNNAWSIATGVVGVGIILGLLGYLGVVQKTWNQPYRMIATIIPAALLIAPYSWNYEQFLLLVPIAYILMILFSAQRNGTAILFTIFIMGLPIVLFGIANILQNDVFSMIVSVVMLISILCLPRQYSITRITKQSTIQSQGSDAL